MIQKNSTECAEKCVIRDILDVIGGKWSIPIIHTLFDGTKRFRELERSIPGINTRMLVKELKNMEANNIVERTVYPTVPPTVEYTLTEKGKQLEPVICELHKWGNKFVNKENT